MNFWKPIILFIFMTAGLLSFKVEARKPAVEPVMGLSIEEYENVPPEQSQGFNFDQNETQKAESRQPGQEQLTVPQTPVASRNLINQSAQSSSPDTPATLFYILLSLLPFVVWFGLMKNLDANREEEFTAEMYDLEEQRRKRDQDHDDDIPKAS